MDHKKCCVCGDQQLDRLTKYAGRWYCPGCRQQLSERNRRPWRFSGLPELGVLLLLVGAAALLKTAFPGGISGFAAMLFCLGVSGVFLVLFYRQDRLEPEPLRLTGAVFLAGMALPLLVYFPVMELLNRSEWARHGFYFSLALQILLAGILMELFKTLLVRYTVFLSDEFDEPVDGAVYASIAGIGFATALNFKMVLNGSGMDPVNVTIRAAAVVLLHASISGVIGIALGRARFNLGRRWVPGAALAAGACLWGVVFMLRHSSRAGLRFDPWLELLLLTLFALAVLAFTLKLQHETLRREEAGGLEQIHAAGTAPVHLWSGFDRWIWTVAAVMLAAGLWLLQMESGRERSYRIGPVQVSAPDSWLMTSSPSKSYLQVEDLFRKTRFATRLRVRVLPWSNLSSAGRSVDPVMAFQQLCQQRYPMYREWGTLRVTNGGCSGIQRDFAYVFEPGTTRLSDLPVVVRGRGVLFADQLRERLFSVEFVAEAGVFDELQQRIGLLLDSVRIAMTPGGKPEEK